MNKNFWKFFISVPAAAIIYVPFLLLWIEFSGLPRTTASWFSTSAGFALLWGGVVLVMWAYTLLLKQGGGEARMNIPTKKLVREGPYRWVRNPMAIGIGMILLGESLYFSSFYIFIWTLIVIEVMSYYITHVEEYKLANKFGQAYIDYKMEVGKWLPKWSTVRSWWRGRGGAGRTGKN